MYYILYLEFSFLNLRHFLIFGIWLPIRCTAIQLLSKDFETSFQFARTMNEENPSL